MSNRIRIQPHPIAYFLSVLVGQLLCLLVLITFLKFSRGHIFVGLAMALGSTVILALFLAWVDIKETEAADERDPDRRKSRHPSKGRA